MGGGRRQRPQGPEAPVRPGRPGRSDSGGKSLHGVWYWLLRKADHPKDPAGASGAAGCGGPAIEGGAGLGEASVAERAIDSPINV